MSKLRLDKKFKNMPIVEIQEDGAPAQPAAEQPAAEPAAEATPEAGKAGAKAKMDQFLSNKSRKNSAGFGQSNTGKVGAKAKSHYRPKI